MNATTLALISAGIPLTDYVCAVSLASYPAIQPDAPAQVPPFELVAPVVVHSNDEQGARGSGSTTLLDCCQEEERSLPTLTVAVLPKSEKVTLVGLETRVGIGRFEEMLRWGIEAGKAIQGAMEDVRSFRRLRIQLSYHCVYYRQYGNGASRWRPRQRAWLPFIRARRSAQRTSTCNRSLLLRSTLCM